MSCGGSGHWFWCQGSEFPSQIVQLAVSLWEMYLPFLGFHFVISRMGVGIVLPHRFILRIRWDRDHETNGNKIRRERCHEDGFKEGRRTGWTLLWGQEGWRLDFSIQHRWRETSAVLGHNSYGVGGECGLKKRYQLKKQRQKAQTALFKGLRVQGGVWSREV